MLHQIGVGVLGPVFRAYDPSRDQPFIVKELRLDVTPEQARQLVEALERLTAAGSFHPGVVAPIASGVQDGTPYLVQEHIAAESLDLAARRYAAGEVHTTLSLLDALADAMDAAHGRGVLHGALHLRDVFIVGNQPRVTGFGIVPALEKVGLRGPLRRPYAAPEMIAGQAWAAAADRHALAAVAYELLTGRRAAGAGAQPGAQVGALDDVPDPEALQAVFAGALADAPEGRPASAGRFAAELRAALARPARRPAPPDDERQDAGQAAVINFNAGEPEDTTRDDRDPAADDAPAASPPAAVDRPWWWSPVKVALVVLLVVASAAAFRIGLRLGGDLTPVGADVQAGAQPAQAAAVAPERATARPPAEPPPVPVPDGAPAAPAAPAPEPVAAAVPAVRPVASTPSASDTPAPEAADPPPPAASDTAAAPPPEASDTSEPAAAAEGSGWVLVRTTPPGARVTMGGADRGLTPLSMGDIPFGSLEIEVHRDGYAPETRQVELSAAQPIAALGIELSQLAGAAQPDSGGAR